MEGVWRDPKLRWRYSSSEGMRIKRFPWPDQKPKDPSEMLKALYNFFESLVIENDVLCWKWSNETSKERSQIVLPKFASFTILKEAHRQVGHLGVAKTFEMIQRRFFWPGFFKTTEEFCKSCKVCARNKVVPRPRWRLRPIEVVPFYMIGVDLIGPLKSTHQGNKYILSFIDY